jgi:AbiU2
MRKTKIALYLDALSSYVTVSRESYQIGRSFSRHKDIVREREFGYLVSSIQAACQTKIIIELGRFFEEYSPEYGDSYSLFCLLKYLQGKTTRIKIINRLAAYSYIGRKDNNESMHWLNRAVISKMTSEARKGNHKNAMEVMRWHRNKNVAHKVPHNKRQAPIIRWNDILLLIKTASNFTRIIDDIYVKAQFHLPDPEDDSDTFIDMSRLITGNDAPGE